MDLGLYGKTEVFFSVNSDQDANPSLISFADKLKNFYNEVTRSEKSYTVKVNSTSDGIYYNSIISKQSKTPDYLSRYYKAWNPESSIL